ncbi:MAG TPA: type II secretion system minor pseudopilin GspJ [Steroidobacteraceae bacterium]|nr:type II secretion system minor pseudopilin GspJ [Steroidobacteraceae bacterium]
MKARGFTLIEILVAMAIFAVVSILAYGGYDQVVKQRNIADETMQRTRAIQAAVLKLSQDFAQMEPRPVREPIGVGVQPALYTGARAGGLVQLTRAGWANPAGIGRSTLQRVQYNLENGALFREQHYALDSVLNDAPLRIQLLDKVRSMQIEYLDVQQQWSPDWPRAGVQAALRARPLAVKFELELEDWGKITRVIEVSNVTVN